MERAARRIGRLSGFSSPLDVGQWLSLGTGVIGQGLRDMEIAATLFISDGGYNRAAESAIFEPP